MRSDYSLVNASLNEGRYSSRLPVPQYVACSVKQTLILLPKYDTRLLRFNSSSRPVPEGLKNQQKENVSPEGNATSYLEKKMRSWSS